MELHVLIYVRTDTFYKALHKLAKDVLMTARLAITKGIVLLAATKITDLYPLYNQGVWQT